MKRWEPAGALALAILLAACGPTSAKTSPPPSAGITPSSGAASGAPRPSLFAVLEARHCQAPEPAACEGVVSGAHDTVAIAGADGFARAKTTFTPRKIPSVGNAATVLDLEGQVANGGVYFIDGAGIVRRLDAAGTVSVIATFSIDSSYQSVSFAVSPDGKQLMAAILTYPKHQAGTDPNNPFGTFSGPWHLQLEHATAGGATTTLHQWQAGTNQGPGSAGGFPDIWLAGWDAQGPLALVGQTTGTQNAWLSNQRYFGGSLARLNPDGTPGAAIGASNCLPYWRVIAGMFVCTSLGSSNATSTINVVDLAGHVVWSGHPPAGSQLFGDLTLSPNGQQLAMDGEVVGLPEYASASAATMPISPTFQPQGWLDDQTLIGWIPQNGPAAPHVGVLHLNDPQHPEDWGFTGAFVGTLS